MSKAEKKSEILQLVVKGMMSFTPWIVGPLAIALLLGKFLDARLDVYPWGTIFASALGFGVTITVIIKKSLAMMQELVGESEVKESKNDTDQSRVADQVNDKK
jgi:F0F1-type ATP synthase assembly protein I